MGQNSSTGVGGGGAHLYSAGEARRALTEAERVILWEVNIARGCLDSFNRMLGAHAIVLSLLVTVNLLAFLQPPRGWDGDSGRMFSRSKSLTSFAISNSISLYTATSGLLFYIYCSFSAIVSLQSVPLPTHFDDPLSRSLLHNLRASFRSVALPSVRRRCGALFSFMAISLIFCIVSYISAGIASTAPHDRLLNVILPAIPGCVCLLFFLQIANAKLRLELDFDSRFSQLWSTMAPGTINPDIDRLDEATTHALDPLPHILNWYYYR